MSSSKKIIQTLPEHGWCFICGRENPKSMGVRWLLAQDRSIFTKVSLGVTQQGSPGFAHSGAAAALLDESMGSAVWSAGHQVVSVNLQINHTRPLPLDVPIWVNAWIDGVEGRVINASSTITLEDETLLVSGHGIYVEAPDLFKKIWQHMNSSE
jgi:hypothetical protein